MGGGGGGGAPTAAQLDAEFDRLARVPEPGYPAVISDGAFDAFAAELGIDYET